MCSLAILCISLFLIILSSDLSRFGWEKDLQDTFGRLNNGYRAGYTPPAYDTGEYDFNYAFNQAFRIARPQEVSPYRPIEVQWEMSPRKFNGLSCLLRIINAGILIAADCTKSTSAYFDHHVYHTISFVCRDSGWADTKLRPRRHWALWRL